MSEEKNAVKEDAVNIIATETADEFEIFDRKITAERFPVIAKIAREIAYSYCAVIYPEKGDEFRKKASDGDISGVFLEDMGDSLFSGTHDRLSNRIVCRPVYSESQIIRILVHENIHAASYNRVEKKTYGDAVCIKCLSGFGISMGDEKNGRKINWALNEGTTEILTIEALHRYGLDGSPSVNYILSVVSALQLKKLVGEDLFYGAYFSGKTEPLIKYVNSLCNNEKCWDALVRNLDAAGTNRDLLRTVDNVRWISSARKNVARIFSILNANKAKGSIRNEGQNGSPSV